MKVSVILFFLLFSGLLPAQVLTIQDNRFLLDGKTIPFWGVRVASASQNEDFTDRLILALDDYKRYGINAISVFIQGSSGGYSNPFSAYGKQLAKDHNARLVRIIEECGKRNMVVIAGIFYQRAMADSSSLTCFPDLRSVFNAVETVVNNLRPYRNVIINIANEQNSGIYRKFRPFSFNDPQNIIRLCRLVKKTDPQRIVGAGGYNDSCNVVIGKSESVDVLLFDTWSDDIEKKRHSGWHYDYFKQSGVPDKPIVNVEIFGAWTSQFLPPGVFTDAGKKIHLQEIDEAVKRPGLYLHFHSNPWIQGPSGGYPARFDMGGSGVREAPGIRWWFSYLKGKTKPNEK